MPHDNSLFHDVLKLLPWCRLDDLTAEHGTEAEARKLTSRQHLIAMLETGKILRILTNDLNATAQEIADLYKRRWAIELFFRWVKQNLKIRKFLGTSENAVRIQVTVALIAFLLLKLVYAAVKPAYSFLEFTRLVGRSLMERRRIDRLLPQSDQATPPQQLRLQWT